MDENRLYEYDYDKPELSETYLEHHGVKGQRKGVRHGPPYPLSRQKKGNGRLAKGRGSIQKKKSSGGLIERYKAKKTYKQRVQSAEKARQAKQAKAEEAKRAQEEQDRREAEALNEEIWRQDVIRRGDAETAAKNTDKFSEAEINAIISRYQTNQRLSQLVADANPNMSNLPEAKKTVFEKMGNAVNEINKFAGPASQLAKNAASVYDLYTKVNSEKDREAKEELNRKQTLANIEQTRTATKSGLERSKAETEQIRANTENIKKGIFPPGNQQNNQQKQTNQQPVQNQNNQQPVQNQNKEKSPSWEKNMTAEQREAGRKLSNASTDALYLGKKDIAEKLSKQAQAVYSGELDPKKANIKEAESITKQTAEKRKPTDLKGKSNDEIREITVKDYKDKKLTKEQAVSRLSSLDNAESKNKSDLPKNTPIDLVGAYNKDRSKSVKEFYNDTAKYRENSKKQLESSKQIAKQRASNAASKILSNPNSQGAISQLIKDATKNTKTTSGKSLNINTDWLASQSTEKLRSMKSRIDNTKNDSSARIINDINKILKKRGAASPLR